MNFFSAFFFSSSSWKPTGNWLNSGIRITSKTKRKRKKAEKKFMDIAAAKEVLSDDEMRQKFDRGEDPLDAEEERERQQQGHPFHGFRGFHGHPGNMKFKFHFN